MKCKAEFPAGAVALTMAIDTPLCFSDEFVTLITRQGCVEPNETSGLNRYLFRHTERHLFERGLRPLSAIKDMIGSQATKGMHVLSKFALKIESCGVWTDGIGFRAIETYPTACRDTPEVKKLLKGSKPLVTPTKTMRVFAPWSHICLPQNAARWKDQKTPYRSAKGGFGSPGGPR